MSVIVEQQAILMSLAPLFERAEAEGLWFFHESHEAGEVWASPEYLRLKQAAGELLWAPEHWELRSPAGYLKTLRTQAEGLVAQYNELAERIGQEKRLSLTGG